jgi:hypothetical protein
MVIDSSEALKAAKGNKKMTTKKTDRMYRMFFIFSPFFFGISQTEYELRIYPHHTHPSQDGWEDLQFLKIIFESVAMSTKMSEEIDLILSFSGCTMHLTLDQASQ